MPPKSSQSGIHRRVHPRAASPPLTHMHTVWPLHICHVDTAVAVKGRNSAPSGRGALFIFAKLCENTLPHLKLKAWGAGSSH